MFGTGFTVYWYKCSDVSINIMCVCMYKYVCRICMVITYFRVWINWVSKVANPARGQLKREK